MENSIKKSMPISETESAYIPIIYGQQTPIDFGQKGPLITTYNSEIFFHESCVYMDVLKELLDIGFFVWLVYDCWYAQKEGVSQDEFEAYTTALVEEKDNEYIKKWFWEGGD